MVELIEDFGALERLFVDDNKDAFSRNTSEYSNIGSGPPETWGQETENYGDFGTSPSNFDGPSSTEANNENIAPKKQLKEKFMQDREHLENSLNAMGDSMYRRGPNPNPPSNYQSRWGGPDGPPVFPWSTSPSMEQQRWDDTSEPAPSYGSFQPNFEQENVEEKKLPSVPGFGDIVINDEMFQNTPKKGVTNSESDSISKQPSININKKALPVVPGFGDAFKDNEEIKKALEKDMKKSEVDSIGNQPCIDIQKTTKKTLPVVPGFGDALKDEDDQVDISNKQPYNTGQMTGFGDVFSEDTPIQQRQTSVTTDSAKSGNDDDTAVQFSQPKKLKEKFMKDRDNLERLLNQYGDSMYRKGPKPKPPPPPPRWAPRRQPERFDSLSWAFYGDPNQRPGTFPTGYQDENYSYPDSQDQNNNEEEIDKEPESGRQEIGNELRQEDENENKEEYDFDEVDFDQTFSQTNNPFIDQSSNSGQSKWSSRFNEEDPDPTEEVGESFGHDGSAKMGYNDNVESEQTRQSDQTSGYHDPNKYTTPASRYSDIRKYTIPSSGHSNSAEHNANNSESSNQSKYTIPTPPGMFDDYKGLRPSANSDPTKYTIKTRASDSSEEQTQTTTPSTTTESEAVQPKKLKEKFMRDREELERILNMKGDSIYRKTSDPVPRPQDDTYTGYGSRIQSADELKFQFTLSKIARAALAVQRKRKSGKKSSPSIIFI